MQCDYPGSKFLHSWHDITLIQQEGVPMSPKRGNLELSRSTSRNPPDSLGAAGTPHKRTMRRTASHLSPQKDQGERLLLLSMMAMLTSFETCTARTSEQTWQMLPIALLLHRLASVWSACVGLNILWWQYVSHAAAGCWHWHELPSNSAAPRLSLNTFKHC